MGFRLADICRMLSFYDDRQRLDECLAAQQAALEAQAEDVARKRSCGCWTAPGND